jgi:hypothetical protein
VDGELGQDRSQRVSNKGSPRRPLNNMLYRVTMEVERQNNNIFCEYIRILYMENNNS